MLKPLVIAAALSAILASPVFAAGGQGGGGNGPNYGQFGHQIEKGSGNDTAASQASSPVPCPHKPADCPMYSTAK